MRRTFLFTLLAVLVCSSVAFADRSAVLFIEMEKEDADSKDLEELLTVGGIYSTMLASYDQVYWLVNEDATRDNFFETLLTAVDAWATVDLYIMAHGGMQYFWGHYDDRIYVDDILGLGSFPNMRHLRMVYVGTCHGWDLTDEFIEIGAKSAFGSDETMVNFPFFFQFLYAFAVQGDSLQEAVISGSAVTGDESFRINGDTTLHMDTDN
ncbi:MAG: hypothetical protein ABFD81_04455 [Syntrophaceae bacterium]